MKGLKLIVVATLITIILLFSCALALTARAEESPYYDTIYPKLAIITKVTEKAVYFRDRDKITVKYYIDPYDEDRLDVGDICTLLMYNSSINPKQHQIVYIRWEGYTSNVTKWIKSMKWRR